MAQALMNRLKQLWTSLRRFLNQLNRLVARPMAREFKRGWQRIPAARRRLIAKSSVAIGVVAVSIIMVTGLGIYALGWQNSWTRAVARVVPYPVAVVDGTVMTYRPWASEVQALSVYQKAVGQDSSQARQTAFNNQMGEILTRRWARTAKIKVDKQQVERAVADIFAAQGGEEAALKILKQEYGYSRADFSAKVASHLLRLEVEKSIAASDSSWGAARARAQKARSDLAEKTSFEVARQRYSEHSSLGAKDEAALVPSSQLPEAVQVAAAKLKDGQYSRAVKATDGYYIVQRVRAAGTELQLLVILLKPRSAGEWYARAEQEAKVIKFLPGL